MGLMPPGSSKSVYSSVVFPTHFLGRFPNSLAIIASYGSELPKKFGRRARSIVEQPIYKRIFDANLSDSVSAADEWALTNGSEWMGRGILTGITGNRADLVVWDDLIKNRQDADSDTIRNRTWEEYKDSLLSRKKPNAKEVGITCMVGDTRVTMADGTEKYLRDVSPGDLVCSYEKGNIVVSKILNWKNCGPDDVFEIRMKSGASVIANARHPFLIKKESGEEWIRLKNLTVGDHALRAIGVNGKTLSAQSAKSQLGHAASATNIMGSGGGKWASTPRLIMTKKQNVTSGYVTVMASIAMLTKQCSKLKMGFVQFAKDLLPWSTQSIGSAAFALTTATQLEKYADSCATTAITCSEKEQLRTPYWQQLNTSEIALDEIISIEPAGREDVFDIQVECTENFIANGLVSHNTRWHEDDIAGRILPEDYNGESGWIDCRDGHRWYVLCLPAECERDDDPLGRKPGDILWPEWFSKEFFATKKLDTRSWSSLYQQRPAPDSGIFFESEWLIPYQKKDLPRRDLLKIYGASDYAVKADGGDYTVHLVVGVDHLHQLWLLDLWRDRKSPDVWIETLGNLIRDWRPLGWAEEKGQISTGIGPFLKKRLMERRLYIARKQFPTTGDKEVRAQSIRGRMASMGLRVPVYAPWYEAFKRELLTFPAGRNDDQVDALGLIGQVLDRMIAGSPQSLPPEKPKVLSTNPELCTVTLSDLFEANEKRGKKFTSHRIH